MRVPSNSNENSGVQLRSGTRPLPETKAMVQRAVARLTGARSHLTYANLVSTLALLAALGGSAYAAMQLPANSIGPRQLKNGAVTPNKVALRTIQLFEGHTGDQGPQGTSGPQGIPGPKGDPGPPGSQLAGLPSVRVTNSADEPIASSDTPTTLTFDRNLYDNASIHSTSTNPSRLTAPIAGVYEIVGEVGWESNATGDRKLVIRRNSSNLAASLVAPDPSNDTFQQVVTQARLNTGDFVELAAAQTSGVDLSVLAFTGPPDPALEMHWLGP